MILFRPKFEEPDADYPEFSLVLSKKQNYDIVCTFQFFRHDHMFNGSSDVGESW